MCHLRPLLRRLASYNSHGEVNAALYLRFSHLDDL